MIEITQEQLLANATTLHQSKTEWHFHLLTPACVLNDHTGYALVLENVDENITYVAHAPLKPLALSNQLAKMLHGVSIVEGNKPVETSKLNAEEKSMYSRARALTDNQKPWHHHLLFSRCHFNTHSPKWTMTLEDQADETVFENTSDEEPTALLAGLERLFYRR